VIQVEETRQVSRVTPATTESGQVSGVTSATAKVGDDPAVVMEVALVNCRLIECRLGDTLVERPQYYLQKALTRPSFSSSLLRSIRLCRYPLGQSRHSQEH
jgi:hypothetical protein